MMRLLADENLHTEILGGLRQANYEVLFVPDLGLAGQKDREILEYSDVYKRGAYEEKR